MPGDNVTAQQASFIRVARQVDTGPAALPGPEHAAPDERHAPGRRLVVCCDGTGNEFGERNTNVVRLYGYLVKDETQLTYYDPGVGTLSPPSMVTRFGQTVARLWGLAFGYGITTDIEDAYKFLMDHYRPNDHVYLFGFSRGAYTARALAGMIYRCGLLPKGSDNLIRYVSKMYLHGTPQQQEEFKQFFCQKHVCRTHFIGVWDTVSSVSFFRPMTFPNTVLNPGVTHGRHALALDERRGMYEPVLWSQCEEHQTVKQVWFTGVHSDVGGGYPERELTDITLHWMLHEAEAEGLKLLPGWHENLKPDPKAAPHNSLHPGWWAMPYRRRAVPAGADVHESVGKRHDTAEAYKAYLRSITRPVGYSEWVRGGVPGFLLLAAIGFLAPLVWWGLVVVFRWLADGTRPAWEPAGAWLGRLSDPVEQGLVGAAVMIGVGLAVWGVRHLRTRA